jgi:hypothetical protein
METNEAIFDFGVLIFDCLRNRSDFDDPAHAPEQSKINNQKSKI